MSTTKEPARGATSRELMATAEEMLPEIRAAAGDIDEARRLPEWLAGKLSAAGFFHLLTGREHGGLAQTRSPPPRSSRHCPLPAPLLAG